MFLWHNVKDEAVIWWYSLGTQKFDFSDEEIEKQLLEK